MRTVLVRYKTSVEHAAADEALIRAVFDELRSRAPGSLRYATYRLADGVTFIHLATHTAPDANALVGLPSFKAFQAHLATRCVEPPVVTELSPIESYADGV
jgi:quinol monooxygenase YgiN